MDDAMREAIARPVAESRAKDVAHQTKQQRTKDEREIARETFSHLCKVVVKPAMLEIGHEVERQGYYFRVDELSYRSEYRGSHEKMVEPSIRLTISKHPLSSYVSSQYQEYPGIAVHFHAYNNTAWFHVRTMSPTSGGQAGGEGECILSELTAEIVQRKTVNFITKLLS